MKYYIQTYITISIQLQWRIHDTTWHNGVAKPQGSPRCPQDGSQQCWGRSTLKKLLQSMLGRTGRTAFFRGPTEGWGNMLGLPGWEIWRNGWKNLGKRWGTMGKYVNILGKFVPNNAVTFHVTNYPTCRGASTGGCWCGTISSSQVVIMLKCYHWSFWRLGIILMDFDIFNTRYPLVI
jgi:hypothetical protein